VIKYTKARIERLLRIEFIRFCIVGGTGFVINFIILIALRDLFGFPAFPAQLIGAEVSLFSNFMLHHHWTYKAHKVEKSIKQLVVQFHLSSWPAIIGSALMVAGAERYLHLDNILALSVSSAIALVWNFLWSKFIIWKDVSSKEVKKLS